ncbi:MAG: hypothetical protein WCT12_05005 [Verrucomicrobiota bacterium]
MKTLNLCLGLVFLIGQHCAVAAIADRFDYPIGNRDCSRQGPTAWSMFCLATTLPRK